MGCGRAEGCHVTPPTTGNGYSSTYTRPVHMQPAPICSSRCARSIYMHVVPLDLVVAGLPWFRVGSGSRVGRSNLGFFWSSISNFGFWLELAKVNFLHAVVGPTKPGGHLPEYLFFWAGCYLSSYIKRRSSLRGVFCIHHHCRGMLARFSILVPELDFATG